MEPAQPSPALPAVNTPVRQLAPCTSLCTTPRNYLAPLPSHRHSPPLLVSASLPPKKTTTNPSRFLFMQLSDNKKRRFSQPSFTALGTCRLAPGGFAGETLWQETSVRYSATRPPHSAIHAGLGKPRAFFRAFSLNFRLLASLWLVTREGKRYREAGPRSVKLALPWKLSSRTW